MDINGHFIQQNSSWTINDIVLGEILLENQREYYLTILVLGIVQDITGINACTKFEGHFFNTDHLQATAILYK